MHAALTIGDDLLMGSDDPTTDWGRTVQGMQVNYSAADAGEAKRAFDALADGGQVNLPMRPTSSVADAGMCVDRFGIPWMVGADPEGS